MNDSPPGRLISLDAFRGLAIAAMILVNNPGSWDHVYPQLLHAEWVGWTFTDFIFPAFMFIVGVAMWYSLKSQSGNDRRDLWRKILLRAALIFLVGLFISWFPFYNLSSENLHFAGVLQRIAVSYVIAALVCTSFGRRSVAVLGALLLLAHWILMAQISGSDAYVKEVFFGLGIDAISFGSSFASAVPIMIGYLVGSYIDQSELNLRTIFKLGVAGAALVLVGMFWSLELPIIKSFVWSSSYILFATGVSIVAFSLCVYLIELRNLRTWAIPFVHLGLNPLFIYAVSIVLDKLTWIIKFNDGQTPITMHTWIYESVFRLWASDINASLMYAICFVALHRRTAARRARAGRAHGNLARLR